MTKTLAQGGQRPLTESQKRALNDARAARESWAQYDIRRSQERGPSLWQQWTGQTHNPLTREGALRQADRANARYQGFTFEFGDEIAGAAAAFNTAVDNLTGRGRGYSPREAYDAYSSTLRQTDRAYAKAHPVESTANRILGGAANPATYAGGAWVAGGGKLAPVIVRSAVVGAGGGAVAGAGAADPGRRTAGAAKGAAVGGAVGAAVPAAGAGVKAVVGTAQGGARAAESAVARSVEPQTPDLRPGGMAPDPSSTAWEPRVSDAARGISPQGSTPPPRPGPAPRITAKVVDPAEPPLSRIVGDEITSYGSPPSLARTEGLAWFTSNLKGKPTPSAALGREVNYNLVGFKKISSGRSGVKKVRLLPAIPEVIAKGRLIASEAPRGEERGVRAYHSIVGNVELGGRVVPVRVVVRESTAGDFHYDHMILQGEIAP